MKKLPRQLCILWTCGLAANFCLAQEASETAKKGKEESAVAGSRPAEVTEAQIKAWLKDLGATSYKTRKKAAQALWAAGVPVLPHLAASLDDQDPESATLKRGLMRKFLSAEEAEIRKAARAQLEAQAKQEGTAGESAQALLAKHEKTEAAKSDHPQQNIVLGDNIIIELDGRAGNGIQVQPFGNGVVGAVQIQMNARNINGANTRSVSVTENGRKIKIQEDGKGISVTDGDKTVQARNVEDLKKEHPDAHKLYEKYLGKKNAKALPGIALPGKMLQIEALQVDGLDDLDLKLNQEVEKQLKKLQKQVEAEANQAKGHVETEAKTKRQARRKAYNQAVEKLLKATQEGADAKTLKKLADEVEAAKP